MNLQLKTVGAKYLNYGEANIEDIPTDVVSFLQNGVPAATLYGDDGRYFWYHHTKADTMSVVDSTQLDLAFYATTAYIIADMDEFMPRN